MLSDLKIGTVLLLEDEPFIAMDVETTLMDAGVGSVVIYDNSAEARQWLASHSPDMVIVDPRLRDGMCCELVRSLGRRKIPFVVHSGELQSVLDAEGAFGFGVEIHKPSLPEELVAAVRKSMESKLRSRPSLPSDRILEGA